MDTLEKHLYVLIVLLFFVAMAVCVGMIGFWAVTHIGQALLVALGLAAVFGVVHLIVRKIDWEGKV